MDTKGLGMLGEKVAEDYLKKKRYEILDRNYSPRFVSGPLRGEIDIVAKKDDIVSFIEVKMLTSNKIISPEEKVDFQKQRKIMKIAESWLMEKKIPLESPWQIDVIAIKIDLNNRKAKIRHFKNAVF
jgi:putative endonuclease